MTGVKIVAKEDSQEEKERKERAANKPSMDECLSLYDFEAVAKSVLPTGAWAYCQSNFELIHESKAYQFSIHRLIWCR